MKIERGRREDIYLLIASLVVVAATARLQSRMILGSAPFDVFD
jgi:hypothetical protein